MLTFNWNSNMSVQSTHVYSNNPDKSMNEYRNKLIELKPTINVDTSCFIGVSRFQNLSVVGDA